MADGPPRKIAGSILQSRRLAGVLIPLFSVRTSEDLGRGEIRGLIPMAEFALAMGHRMIQLLPVNETAPGETSPYSAMSVLAIDPLYVSAHGLDGVDAADIEAARASAGPGDPPDAFRLKAARMELLRKSFHHFTAKANPDDRRAFEEFEDRNREWLKDYALFRALKEKFRWSAWASWPDGLNLRAPSALAAAARELANETSVYSYIQFVAHRQWQQVRAGLAQRGVLLGGDLAFSPARESAEVWSNQEMFDLARTVGAPPDAFSKDGQRWGLPMPGWAQMRADGFSLIRTRIRHARELYDLLRIDHVVGLFRTYAFGADPAAPGAFDPLDEADQRAQGEEIIRLVKKEADALEIFAEDLGLIPSFVRKSLLALGVPGYKVMRWEREWDVADQPFIDPRTYSEVSVATTGTHDTDTMAEWWREASADERRQFVVSLKLEGAIDPARKSLDDRAIDAILGALYAAPSRLTIAPVQDLFGWDTRINVPGTVGALNWKWRLPFALDRTQDRSDLRLRIAALRAIASRTRRF
jgi:4-alpha-glucanotransferase